MWFALVVFEFLSHSASISNQHYYPTTVLALRVLQKVSLKIVGFASLVAISVSSQLVEAKETKVNHSTDTANNIVCLSASGNGYNWAATLTWAAEIIKDAASKAADDARLNVSCVAGASSGSAFVSTYGSLLQNKQLFDRADFSPQNITTEEAEILSNALLYMALAADYRPEVVSFYTALDGESQPDPPWWKSQYSLERVMLDFGTRVMLAQHISQTDVKEVEQLDRFVRYQTLDELATAAKDREIREEYRQVTFGIWQQSQAILDRLYENANYKRREREKDRDDFKVNPEHPVRKALAQKPADGILALNYSELAFTESTVDYKKMRDRPPAAENLVPFVFANQATAEKIIESPFYQSRVRQDDPYVGQYVICVVPDYYTMIRLGVKEPEMMPPGVYRLSPLLPKPTTDLAAGVSHFYQPLAEKNWNSQPQFKLSASTRPLLQEGKLLNARMGVAGGWIDSYVSGQATLYLGSGYASEKSSSDLYVSTFSRQDGMTKFAKKVVRKYFAPKNSKEAIAKIEQHRDYLPVLMESYREFYDNHNINWQPVFVEYAVRFFSENKNLLNKIVTLIDSAIKVGLSYPPAAITKQSNYLLARTTNVVRQTLGTNEDLGYIYDRSYKDRYYQQEEDSSTVNTKARQG